MSKFKLEQRMQRAVDAFFDPESERGHQALRYAGGATAVAGNEARLDTGTVQWSRILREVLMFGPGTFALFYMTLTAIFWYPGVGPRPSAYLLAIFLTYAGSGSLRNIKNFAVPATVITLAAVVVFVSLAFLGRQVADHYFWESIYLLPFVWVTAKLVQQKVKD